MVVGLNLNHAILELQGPECIIPGCTERWVDKAHIEPSGMGGRPSTLEVRNLVGLCRLHHRIFDGNQLQGRQHLMRLLMRSHADHIRDCVSPHRSFATPPTSGSCR